MIFDAPISKARSSSPTGAIAIRSPSPAAPRACLDCSRPWRRPARDLAIPAFELLFRARGLPLAIRSDNGVPFASPNGLFNFSKLSVWRRRLSIEIERIDPGHLRSNGRHDRLHLTFK